MRRILLFSFLIIFFLIIAAVVWFFTASSENKKEGSKQQPIAVSKHSSAFINSVDSMMESYYVLTDAFVRWDSAGINAKAGEMMNKLRAVRLSELQKDTSGIYETAESFLSNAKNDAASIEKENDLESKRRSLNSLSENIFNFLRVIQYDKTKLYLQECPMAFNDTESGLWLSKTPEIRNPYLGMHHPRYKSGMLKCGETKETLNYTGTK